VNSDNPEIKAYKKIIEWGKRNNAPITDNTRLFGFNDPCPEPGQTVNEYEAWMSVDSNVTGSEDIEVFDFSGGTYAVKETKLTQIGNAWSSLSLAVKNSDYRCRHAPALEEPVTNPLETPFQSANIILYLPVEMK
jgi:DNA gyrase inhibitor GyrI